MCWRKGLPWLVAETDGQVLGYAYCQLVQAPPGLPLFGRRLDLRGRRAHAAGRGPQLLAALAAQAEAAGVRKLIAVIGDSANAGSIGRAPRAGVSAEVGVLVLRLEVRPWLDVVLMEKAPGRGGHHAPAMGA
jgi:L-amino acid N-acyltransferase YncA